MDRATRKKHVHYLKMTGRSLTVPPGPSIKRVQHLHDVEGMTFQDIADAIGTGRKSITDLYHERRGDGTWQLKSVKRSTEEALLQVRPPKDMHKDKPLPHSALLRAHGARRRLDALSCEGFPLEWLAEDRLKINKHNVHRLFMPSLDREFIRAAIMVRVKNLYIDLDGKTPDDFGIPQGSQNLTRTFAVRREAAPRHCWDDDTIDDPDAIAEWTGHCGTMQGYYIHKREGQTFWSPYANDRRSGRFVTGCTPCRKVYWGSRAR